ncbi:MAG: efflux transporter outer membrane subunit [Acidobacteria bacterium]|nr:efflux transporter outer membrane subunit [Acidobacteriota bacterium]MBI3489225.1 efflux transporter outer membrane subunit [Acidobacteriota bacterium]
MNKLVPPLLFLLLQGCRPVGPNYTPQPQPVPEAYATKGGAIPLPFRWWEPLGDPQLNGLIDQALAHSPDLKIAEARLRQSRAVLGVQEGAGGPNLGVGAQVSRDHLSRNSEMLANLPLKTINTDFTNFQIGFDASWEIDLFGHNRRLTEAALARSEASAERLQDAGLVLSSEVARNVIEYRTGRQRLALALDILAHHDELVRLVGLQAQAGESTRLEVQRAETNRVVYESSLADLRIALRQNLAALSTLTDLPVATLEARLGEPAKPMVMPEAPAAGLPSDLLKHRPDVRAAERDWAAANADLGVAVADQYPRFSLVGTGGWASIQSGTLLTNASRLWSVGPQLHLPLFQSGRLKNQVKANEAAYEAAAATYRKAVLGAVGDVEVALTRLSRSEERRQQLVMAETRQQNQVSLTELQWKAGEVSKATLLEARKNLLNQQDQTLKAQSQSLSALVALCKALGGGWTA